MSIYLHNGKLNPTPNNIISIDPAIKNLAIRYEYRTYDPVKTNTILFDKIEIDTYSEIIHYLDQHPFNPDCVIIEYQIPTNYKAVRVSQTLLTYYLIKYNNANIVEVHPSLKNKVISHSNRKLGSIIKAYEILKSHNDDGYIIMDKFKKKDDLADTVCQIESYLLSITHIKW
jgi:hypothetical protein